MSSRQTFLVVRGFSQLCLLLVLVAGRAPAQEVNNKVNIGLPENGVFSGSSFDLVQMNNRNLHIEIPLWSTQGRGLNFAIKYVYDNKGWYFATTCNKWGVCTDHVMKEPGNSMQFKLVTPFDYARSQKITYQQCSPGVTKLTYTSRVLREPDGTKHHMLPDPAIAGGNTCWGDFNGKAYADDGSGWMFPNDGTIGAVRKDGTVINLNYDPGGQWAWAGKLVQDTNGNQLIQNGDTGVVTDTLGRVVPMDGSYHDSSGTLRQLSITDVNVPVQTALCGFSNSDFCNDTATTFTMPQQITLPNGMSYIFTYAQNQHGEPLSVILPTGGQISWTWNDPIDEGGRSVATRTATVGGQSHTWTYSNANGGKVTDPLGNDTVHTCTFLKAGFQDDSVVQANAVCQINDIKYYAGPSVGGRLLKTAHTDFSTTGAVLPIRETTTWNQSNLVTKVETDWDVNSTWSGTNSWKNPTNRREYAFGTGAAGALVRRTSFTYLATTAYRNLNITDRPTSRITYDGASVIKAQTQYTYDGTALTATSGAPNHDYTGFGSGYLTRGNATQVRSWLNTTGTWLATNNAYDDLGTLRTSTDPGGHVTTYSYTDDWANAACVPGGVNTQAYVSQATNHLGHRAQTRYFPCTGLPERNRDENNILAGIWGRIFTYDLMNRTLTAVQSDGGETDYTYDDVPPVSVTSTSKITGSMNLVSTAIRDGLGRASQSELSSDPEPPGPTKLDTTYDALGRTATVTNPYRSMSDLTYGSTSYQYDALGRVTLVIPPDGSQSANNVSTVYSGNCVTATDQAGKKRKSCSDALGRLTQVFEPDAAGSFLYETAYQYDTLDNLTRVDQKGNDANSANWRTRTFTYNSLSQLLSASNPESGAINYTYDNDGNLLTKVAPLPNQTGTATVTTTYAYDALHRLTGKTYSNGDPAVSYFYDQTTYNGLTITNGKGRRTGMSDVSGITAWSYDSEGRALTERRTIAGFTKVIAYTYNLDGSLASLTYPSGRTVSYAYNAAARPLSAIDAANGINYATAATYAPQGALAGVKYGVSGGFTGIVTSNTYNPRLQPVVLSATAPAQTVLSFSYGFGLGTANNGNVLQIQNNRDLARTQTFTYDELNRVKTAEVPTAWGLSFGYDIWANLLSQTVTKGSAPMLSVAATTKNQIAGFCYDAAGNLLGETNCSAYAYDAENRMTASAAGGLYFYDGDGKRVKKSSGKLYWTGIGSDALAESDLLANFTADYIFFGGKRIARLDLPGGTVHYYFSDHLGSSNVVTNATGTIEEESDFYPFGGERTVTDLLPDQRYKFTGKERDPETGLDYFGARYYSSSLGRFITPDWAAAPTAVPYAEFGDPQSLNLYGYVRNNPLSKADPDGHCPFCWQLVTWASVGIGTRGLKPFAKDAGIGAAKGAAKFGIDAGQSTVNTLTAGAAAPLLKGEPKSIQPSNTDQAAASFLTQSGLNAAAAIGTMSGARAAAGTALSTEQQLQSAANRAAATVGPGSGGAHGTAVHGEFAAEVNSLGNANLTTEQSYLNGAAVRYGTPGSVRPDVVEGAVANPTAAFDLKTGGASLTPARTQQIQSQLPGGSNVPVTEIKPKP